MCRKNRQAGFPLGHGGVGVNWPDPRAAHVTNSVDNI